MKASLFDNGVPVYIHLSFKTGKWTYFLPNGVGVLDGELTTEIKQRKYEHHMDTIFSATYKLKK